MAIDQLDGFQEPAGRFALPNFAEASLPQSLDQAIPRNGLLSRARDGKRRIVFHQDVVGASHGSLAVLLGF